MIDLNSSRGKYKDRDHTNTMAILIELLFVFLKLAILKSMAKLMTTMMMINLILEVRYDKDGPMGEKTDRRVRIGDHQSIRVRKCLSAQTFISKPCRQASQWDNKQTWFSYSCSFSSGLIPEISIKSSHFGLSSATLEIRCLIMVINIVLVRVIAIVVVINVIIFTSFCHNFLSLRAANFPTQIYPP